MQKNPFKNSKHFALYCQNPTLSKQKRSFSSTGFMNRNQYYFSHYDLKTSGRRASVNSYSCKKPNNSGDTWLGQYYNWKIQDKQKEMKIAIQAYGIKELIYRKQKPQYFNQIGKFSNHTLRLLEQGRNNSGLQRMLGTISTSNKITLTSKSNLYQNCSQYYTFSDKQNIQTNPKHKINNIRCSIINYHNSCNGIHQDQNLYNIKIRDTNQLKSIQNIGLQQQLEKIIPIKKKNRKKKCSLVQYMQQNNKAKNSSRIIENSEKYIAKQSKQTINKLKSRSKMSKFYNQQSQTQTLIQFQQSLRKDADFVTIRGKVYYINKVIYR